MMDTGFFKEDDGELHLSSRERLEQVAQRLMWDQDLSSGEILGIVETYFGREKTRCGSFYILKDGFSCSFQSEIPFVTASIYYRNLQKIYPRFEIELCMTASKMFKNMIMERSSTGVTIRSEPEYCEIQHEYVDAFHVAPPKRTNVFAALVQDRNSWRKLLDNPYLFQRIVDIFSFVEPYRVATLRADLLEEYRQILTTIPENRASQYGSSNADRRREAIRQQIQIIRNTKYLTT